MSIDLQTVISLSADVTLVIVGIALLFLVLWQDIRRPSNHYFALCMLFFSAFGVANLPFRIAQHAQIDPAQGLHMMVLFYVLGIVLLIDFLMLFSEVSRPVRNRVRGITLPLAVGFSYLALTHRVYDNFSPAGSYMYQYDVTPWGVVGVAVAALWLGSISVMLLMQGVPKTREAAFPSLIVIAGVVVLTVFPSLREYSINTIAMSLAAFLMGRVVIKYQVFQPLADLNETLSQKNDELVYATRAKAQFLANMSHELRTPLNSIIGYTELVGDGTYGDLNERQRDRLQKVTRNGRLLLNLINDVLDLSKIEAGRVELDLQVVDTNALMDSVLKDYEAEAVAKGLSLIRAYIKLPSLRVDPDRARQILANVVSNAVRFTERGVVIVRGYVDVSRQQVVLSITDTGPGIEVINHEHVFEAFQQAEGTLVHAHDRTGLGLAIARRLTTLHNGNLWFETVVGEGTTFHVALPLAETVAEEPGDQVIYPRRWRSGPAILVIDDDHEAVEMLQDQLESEAYQVYGAHTAAHGVRMVQAVQPSLVILDIALPDIDGWHVFEELRSNPSTADIPIVIISASDAAEMARSVGAEAFIAKPVQTDDLMAQVHQLAPGFRLFPSTSSETLS